MISITLLLLLYSATIANTHLGKGGENTQESETLSMGLFLGYDPWYGVSIIKNVLFDFNTTKGPPINISLLCFNDYFQSTEYEIIPWGRKGLGVRITTFYDSFIDNDTADFYTAEICEEFLRIFNQTNLKKIDSNRSNIAEDLKIIVDYGYFQENLTLVWNLLQYKPPNGFGTLITKEFLRKYVPGNETSGLIELSYMLYKVGSETFSWRFMIAGSIGEILKEEERVEEVSLNSLLSNTEPITPMDLGLSRIDLVIQKKRNTYDGTYFINLEQISPVYTSKKENNNVQITYHLDEPIDDIIAKIRISKEMGFDWVRVVVFVALIGLATTLSGLMLVKIRRKKHRSSTLGKNI
jgi:hypothetical protein